MSDTVTVMMECIECHRVREVYVPVNVYTDDFTDKYEYVCCRCVGVAQQQAMLLKKEDAK